MLLNTQNGFHSPWASVSKPLSGLSPFVVKTEIMWPYVVEMVRICLVLHLAHLVHLVHLATLSPLLSSLYDISSNGSSLTQTDIRMLGEED